MTEVKRSWFATKDVEAAKARREKIAADKAKTVPSLRVVLPTIETKTEPTVEAKTVEAKIEKAADGVVEQVKTAAAGAAQEILNKFAAQISEVLGTLEGKKEEAEVEAAGDGVSDVQAAYLKMMTEVGAAADSPRVKEIEGRIVEILKKLSDPQVAMSTAEKLCTLIEGFVGHAARAEEDKKENRSNRRKR